MSQQIGYISQIIGPVVDVHFPLDGAPPRKFSRTSTMHWKYNTPMAAHS